jgi:hypothetical protein
MRINRLASFGWQDAKLASDLNAWRLRGAKPPTLGGSVAVVATNNPTIDDTDRAEAPIAAAMLAKSVTARAKDPVFLFQEFSRQYLSELDKHGGDQLGRDPDRFGFLISFLGYFNYCPHSYSTSGTTTSVFAHPRLSFCALIASKKSVDMFE